VDLFIGAKQPISAKKRNLAILPTAVPQKPEQKAGRSELTFASYSSWRTLLFQHEKAKKGQKIRAEAGFKNFVGRSRPCHFIPPWLKGDVHGYPGEKKPQSHLYIFSHNRLFTHVLGTV
jgi:hypothetical protein